MSESERIREAYARQAVVWQDDRYRSWMPGNLLGLQERDRVLIELLRKRKLLPLGDARVLDVGCGPGKVLHSLLRLGAAAENLAGVDLLEHEIEGARRLAPAIDFRVGDATSLPFAAASFDLVLTFTAFSSMREQETRERSAAEIRRVLRPGGGIVWYDFWADNARNQETRAIRLGEVRSLFPGAAVEARRVTLAPPLARAVAPRSWLAAELLAKVPLLRTHWLAFIEVP